MCRNATALILAAALAAPVWAQAPGALEWRRVGNTVTDLSLASLAGGPVDRVWYSADGLRLFAKTKSGKVWQTSDFETWQPASGVEPPERNGTLLSGPNSTVSVAHPLRASRLYAGGAFVLRSDDGGLNWTNVSQAGSESILGEAVTDVAVSPRDLDEVVVSGTRGVWRSLDGGASWTGLNDALPNFPVQRILSNASETGLRVLSSEAELVWTSGERVAWRPAATASLPEEQQNRARAAAATGREVSAIASSGASLYAGTPDGLLFFSRDRGAHWGASGLVAGTGRVLSIRADAAEANLAVAATASRGRGRILRTTTGGVYWEDLTGNLAAGVSARGVVFDRGSSAVYVATDAGVFFAFTEAGPPVWTLLRAGSATDVALDGDGNQLYASFEEAGVFAALAPHRLRDPRVVSAADRIARAAAPGSLLSVIGARVRSATVGERNAPILAVNDVESQIQVPFDASASTLRVATSGGSRQFGLTLLPAAPSIFVDRDGVPLVMNADTGLVLDPATPARSGARLQILATGLGRVTPEWPTGLAAPLENPPTVVAPVLAYLDREPVEVTRATLAPGYIGMYLIEIQAPSIVNRGAAEFYIEAQGQQSNRIRIYLEP